MRLPWSPPGSLHRRSNAAALALVAGAALAGCAARGRFEAERPAEVLVEVLPRSAEVWLDGRPVLRGGGTVADPALLGARVVAFRAEGFVAEERALPGDGAAGLRVGAALRPEGFGGPPLELDDARALAAAAAFLLGGAEAADAADYAERAAALDPGLAPAHRILGEARARLGDARGAAGSFREYLRVAPRAADAAAIERRIGELGRGEAPPGR